MDQEDLDKWLRTLWGVLILVTLSVGAYLYLSAQSEPSLKVFIPSGIIGGALALYEILMHIRNLFPQYDLPTWLSVFLMMLAVFALFQGLTETDEKQRTGYFTFAGTVFGLGSGIPIGRLTSGPTRKTSGSTVSTTP
jgi:hypothetical protein